MKWVDGWIAIVVMLLSGCDCGGNKGDSAARWLDLEIEHPEIEESESFFEDQVGEIGEDGLLTNTYFIPPSFLTSVPGVASDDGAAPDPFAAPPEDQRSSLRNVISPKEVLEAYGVDFGPGASAQYNFRRMRLRVTQTPDQMDLVEAVSQSLLYCGSSDLAVQIEIFELSAGDALILEQSATEASEHAKEHEAVLQMVRDNSAHIVTSGRILCRSGQRSRYEDAEEVRYVSEFTKPENDDPKPTLPVFEVMKVGTAVEADPVLGPDNLTVDVNIKVDHHLAPPDWTNGGATGSTVVGSPTPQFHIGSIKTAETILSGQVKLLCSWAVPADGTETRLRHLVFFTVTVVGR